MSSLGRAGGVALAVILALPFAPALQPAVAGPGLQGQELARRVGSAEGPVSLRIALRDGVEVCENGVTVNGDRQRWDSDDRGACSEDVAELVVDVRSGRVTDLELAPWQGRSSRPGAEDLGLVSPEDAARFLTGLAAGRPPASERQAVEEGLMVSVLLDDVEVWPALLEVARRRDVATELRRAALFWTGQVAAETVTAGIREVATESTEESEIREAAVFALSQRPADESIPALVEVVRTAPDAETRRSALFWLAQHDDPRVVEFFEEILAGR